VFATNTGAEAIPEEPVEAVAVLLAPGNVPLGPVAGAVNVTVTPATAFPSESVTMACRESRNGLVTGALCGDPAAVPIRAATPTVFVRAKSAVAIPRGSEAVTVYEPATTLAVKTPEVAMPLLSVLADDPPVANVPLGPDTGAVQVTRTPLAEFPAASLTRAPNRTGNAVPT
jgi:hypothetical protein